MRMRLILIALVCVFTGAMARAAGNDAVCYNCPPEWADWGTMLKAIQANTGVAIPPDNKNSGQSVAQMIAEAKSPIADVVYYGVTFGIEAKAKGLIQPYKPAHFSEIPAGLRDPDGYWFTVHSGTLGLFVNVDALKGKPVPHSWKDLLKPDYKWMIGYLDPSSAFVGYVGAVAVNNAMGGTLDNFEPGLAFFKQLQGNAPIVPKQTAYARVLSGEIPILFDYDFNAYRAKYTDKANVAFVIPSEGSVSVPYVMSMVKNDPNPENAKKALDFILSDKGQAIWANAYMRPVIGSIPKEAAAHFLPATEYARVHPIDYQKMAAVQAKFGEAYLAAVR